MILGMCMASCIEIGMLSINDKQSDGQADIVERQGQLRDSGDNW